MGLRELYTGIEDKWYSLLDKIDSKVPIYKIIDPIDRVVPSLVLVIAVIAILLGVFFVLPLLSFGGAAVTITVEDEQGNLLQGVKVDYTISGVIRSATTNADGQIAFNAPMDSEVGIRVEEATVAGVEYEAARETVEIGEERVSEKIVLRMKEPPYTEHTVIFQNAAGERITGKAIKVRLSCQSPLATPDPLEVTDLDMDGSIVVRKPRDCGVFQATIIAPAEFQQKSYILSKGTEILRLEGLEVAKGTLRVKVKDASGSLVDGTNFTVELLDLDGALVGEKYTLNYGEAIFTNITVGSYTVSVEDSGGDYGLATVQATVSVDETTTIDVVVSRTVKATINVRVVDADSGAGIENATVRLLDEAGNTLVEKGTGDAGEEVVFYLTEQADYTLIAMHEDYLYEIVELQDAGDTDVEIELERLTAQNSGRVEVKVLDEDGAVVKNARVKLRFLETGMLVPHSPEFSDRNGVARFLGVKAGSYYAYVEKYPAFGDNMGQGREIDIREVTRFTVQLFIGNSMVEVRAVDEDGLPVHEAEAEFFSEQGESFGKIPLTQGTGQHELKADKRVYVVVSHADYQAVQTMPKQLWPDQAINFVASMEPRLILGEPRLQFEGIFNSAGSEVQQLDAGQKYVVKFKLSVPEEGNYRRGGFHFRVGEERFLQNDPLVIKEVIAGNIGAPVKGTSFSPPTGYADDLANVTQGDAKWVNVQWGNLLPRNYFFGFEVRVKNQITPYTRLAMHYRAEAVDNDGYYVRVPEDETLGSAESVSGKQALYAKTYDLEFLEGSPADCQEDFCYSGESILDLDRGLYIYEPYSMRSGTPFKFTFDILNNSERRYEDSELYITVDGLTVTGYNVQNASAQEISAENVSLKEIAGIDLGEFTRGKSVGSEVHFTAVSPGNASIEVKVVADGRVVFLRNIAAQVVSENVMVIWADPPIIPAYIPSAIEINVEESVGGQRFGISDALVRLTATRPDRSEQFFTGRTNGFGKAFFDLPELEPGTKVVVEAEKPEYYAEPLEILVDSNVLAFDPSALRSSLDTRGVKEQAFAVEVRNMVGIDVELKDIALTGTFKGLLDKATMVNYAKQHAGTRFTPGESITREFFKAVLSRNARELLLRNEVVNGEFVVSATNSDGTVTWDMVVPLQVAIAIGELPDNAPCLVITRESWDAATLENSATIEFEIQNNCLSSGSFVELDSLEAMVEWQGNILGTVELTVTEAETGSSNSEVLRPEMWTRLFRTIHADSKYYAMLTFTPKGGHLGESAQFSVKIDGKVATGSGTAFVGSTPPAISANIKIVNLEQCITYTDAENILELSSGQNDATFTVDASDCGNTQLTVELCRQNSYCAGGAEGGIGVVPLTFTLSQDSPSQEVMVSRQSIPGMYGINVEARIPGISFREVNNIDVLVAPDSMSDFLLDKYELNVKGIGASDEAKLTNNALAETVSVDASACDWGTAEEEGMFDLAGAGMGAAIGALLGMDKALKAASAGPASSLKQAAFKETQELSEALEQVNTANDATETANDLSEAAEAASKEARDQAIKKAKADVSAAKTAANGITASCDTGGVKASLQQAKTEMDTADNLAKGTFSNKIDSMWEAIKSGFNWATSAVVNIFKGRSTASPNEAVMVSTGPYESIEDIDETIDDTKDAIEDVTKNKEDLILSDAEAGVIIQQLEQVQATLANALWANETTIGACRLRCTTETNECCSSLTAAQATGTKIQTAIQSVENALQATETAKEKIGEAITGADNALGELGSAETALGTAKDSMGRLGDVMEATEKAASFNYGKFLGIIGTYMGLGALAGGLLGGVFGDDPCEERFQATLMDYIMNLKDDALPIAMDRLGITAEWRTDEAQVFGDYERQEVGIQFTNSGIEPGKPVYSTAVVSATRHYHANPTIIPLGQSGFGPFNVPDSRSGTYLQKFHLKFNTKDIVLEVPPLPDEETCLMGTLVGRTGQGALPKVKLDWSWAEGTGIAMNECDYLNGQAVYCDATQFAIMASKRMHALDEFLAANMPLPCPPNPGIEELDKLVEEFNNRLFELEMDPIIPVDTPECWMPRSTVLFDGKPALLYYVEANIDDIAWTADLPDLGALRDLLHFKAYLMKDGYSSDFQNDFAEFYVQESFYDAPEWFVQGDERFAGLFENTDTLQFRTRYVGGNKLPSAGLYDVVLAVNFFNVEWRFFDNGTADSQTVVDMHLLENPYPDSIFYSLPFNGNVGKESHNGRVGYGMNFDNRKQNIQVMSQGGNLIDTGTVSGSSTVSVLETDIELDVKKINASASNRGFLMNVEQGAGLQEKRMVFSPNYATPIMMLHSQGEDEEPFSVFYQLQDALIPVEVGTNLGFWTGMGQCLDFTGVPVFEAFDFKADREARQRDPLSGWEFAYAVDWEKADYGGDVYLKTVFFTPTAGSYSVKALQPAGLKFISPDSTATQVVELRGIGGMQHNSKDNQDSVESLQDIFDLVEAGQACVTNSGTRTAFWWNPKTLYEAAGSNTSVQVLEQGLVAGDNCIGYGS